MTTRLKIKDQLEKSANTGSIVRTDVSNEAEYLAPATDGQVLTLTSGAPTWEDAPGGNVAHLRTVIVDPAGDGDYTDLNAALAANTSDAYIQVKKGTYTLTANYTLSNVRVGGEEKTSTIIDFAGFKISGVFDFSYFTFTLDAASNTGGNLSLGDSSKITDSLFDVNVIIVPGNQCVVRIDGDNAVIRDVLVTGGLSFDSATTRLIYDIGVNNEIDVTFGTFTITNTSGSSYTTSMLVDGAGSRSTYNINYIGLQMVNDQSTSFVHTNGEDMKVVVNIIPNTSHYMTDSFMVTGDGSGRFEFNYQATAAIAVQKIFRMITFSGDGERSLLYRVGMLTDESGTDLMTEVATTNSAYIVSLGGIGSRVKVDSSSQLANISLDGSNASGVLSGGGNVTISGTQVRNVSFSLGTAIFNLNGRIVVTNNAIENSAARSSRRVIQAAGGGGSEYGAIITGNRIVLDTEATGDVIYLVSSLDNSIIQGNLIIGSGSSTGVEITQSGSDQCENTVVSNNTIRNCSTQVLDNGLNSKVDNNHA